MARRADLHNARRSAQAVSASASAGSASLTDLKIAYLSPQRLRPSRNNARTHSKKQLKQIARSIERFGFVNPVLISDELEVIAGHGRLEAAKMLGMTKVPTVRLSNLSAAERRAYLIADNRLAELAGWDRDLLAIELQGLVEIQFDDIELTGFSLGEIDQILDEAAEKTAPEPAREDDIPAGSLGDPAVSRAGDLWVLGSHRLLCGDAADPTSYQVLLDGEQAGLVLADPPRNVSTEGNISGDDQAGVAMVGGETSEHRFIAVARAFLERGRENTKDGTILFVFVDWQHLYGLLTASREAGLALKDLVVWSRGSAPIGSFYRSGYELVLVLQNGEAPRPELAKSDRRRQKRTNIWEYAAVSRSQAGRIEGPARRHRPGKPAALIADAMRDVTQRGAIVLDPFAGDGATIIAAEKTGRHGRAIERDPLACDLIVRRWQQYTGEAARLAGSDLTFDDVEATRRAGQSASTA